MIRNTTLALGLTLASIANAASVTISDDGGVATTDLDGFTTFVVSILSDMEIEGLEASFSGNLNQLNPAGSVTIFDDNNAFIPLTGGDVSQDSQFLFNTSELITPPGELGTESATELSSSFTFAAANPPANVALDFAQIVLPTGETAALTGNAVINGAFVPFSATIGGALGGDVTLTPADGAVFDLAINSNPEIIDAITATGGTITDASFDDPAADALLNLTFDDDSVSIAIDTTQDFTGLSPDTILSETFTVLTSDGASAQFTINAAVPEPASLALLGLGFAGVIARRRLV